MRERTSESFSNSSPTAGSQDETVPEDKSQTSQVDIQKATASPSAETVETPETLENMKATGSGNDIASEEKSGAESESPEVN
jgi:hypothetical protein